MVAILRWKREETRADIGHLARVAIETGAALAGTLQTENIGLKKVIHAGFDDPPMSAEGATSGKEALGHYRRVRDEMRGFVEKLPEVLRWHDEEN